MYTSHPQSSSSEARPGESAFLRFGTWLCVFCVIFWESLQMEQGLTSDSVTAGRVLALFVRRSYCFSFFSRLGSPKVTRDMVGGGGKLAVNSWAWGCAASSWEWLSPVERGLWLRLRLPGTPSRSTTVLWLETPKIGPLLCSAHSLWEVLPRGCGSANNCIQAVLTDLFLSV